MNWCVGEVGLAGTVQIGLSSESWLRRRQRQYDHIVAGASVGMFQVSTGSRRAAVYIGTDSHCFYGPPTMTSSHKRVRFSTSSPRLPAPDERFVLRDFCRHVNNCSVYGCRSGSARSVVACVHEDKQGRTSCSSTSASTMAPIVRSLSG